MSSEREEGDRRRKMEDVSGERLVVSGRREAVGGRRGTEESDVLEGAFISLLRGDFVVLILWHYTTQVILPGLCTGT